MEHFMTDTGGHHDDERSVFLISEAYQRGDQEGGMEGGPAAGSSDSRRCRDHRVCAHDL